MNTGSWRSKLVEAVAVLIVLAVVLRVVSGVLKPLLPGMIGLLIVGGLITMVLRRR